MEVKISIVIPAYNEQDKIKRARAIQYRHRAHMVQYDVSADWFASLQQEMMHFPRGKYSDQVDA